MKWFKNIVFTLIMLALMLPLAQQWYCFSEVKPLYGAFDEPGLEEFNAPNWWSGTFQDNYSAHFEFHFGFRPIFIRLRNQLYYWIYGRSTNFVVPGKNDQLFSWDYWSAYRGLDEVGADDMQHKINNLALLRDSLKHMGKPLLCVIAPNKVRYMPENLPESYVKEPAETTNYSRALKLLHKEKIPTLDVNALFLDIKDTAQYPLFANTSTHWSGYGMNLGVAWMIDTLEALGEKDLINVNAEWQLRDSILPSSDRDMADLMNLLYPLPSEPLAFPDFDLTGQGTAQPAKILIIGDSFFWNYYAFEIRHQLFHPDTRFWYYNNTQRDLYGQETPVSELSAHEAIRKADYVVILATEANLYMFPYGFPEKFLGENTGRE